MSFHIQHCFWETLLKTDLFLSFFKTDGYSLRLCQTQMPHISLYPETPHQRLSAAFVQWKTKGTAPNFNVCTQLNII